MFGVACFIITYSLEYGDVAVIGVVIVEYILVNIKVNVFHICLVDCEYSIIELALSILKCQNVGDGSFIEPCLTISLYMRFFG